MYRMPTVKRGKTLYLTLCCFCERCDVGQSCVCQLGLAETDECPQYESVSDPSARTALLFERLPNGYGETERLE